MSKLISDFECSKNEDIPYFLKNKAIRFEESEVAKTYLIIDEEQIYNENENFRILAYFALSLKTIDIPEGISGSKIKKLDGINKKAKSITCYLIGQLGKNDLYNKEIEGSLILNHALELINEARKLVGRTAALVECEDNENLIKFYEKNDFERIGKSEENGLLRFVRFIKNKKEAT